jgi:hypothetical protein
VVDSFCNLGELRLSEFFLLSLFFTLLSNRHPSGHISTLFSVGVLCTCLPGDRVCKTGDTTNIICFRQPDITPSPRYICFRSSHYDATVFDHSSPSLFFLPVVPSPDVAATGFTKPPSLAMRTTTFPVAPIRVRLKTNPKRKSTTQWTSQRGRFSRMRQRGDPALRPLSGFHPLLFRDLSLEVRERSGLWHQPSSIALRLPQPLRTARVRFFRCQLRPLIRLFISRDPLMGRTPSDLNFDLRSALLKGLDPLPGLDSVFLSGPGSSEAIRAIAA